MDYWYSIKEIKIEKYCIQYYKLLENTINNSILYYISKLVRCKIFNLKIKWI